MKLYQLINSGGYPASVMENDLALFATIEDAQEALDYFNAEDVEAFEGATIKEINRLDDIVR